VQPWAWKESDDTKAKTSTVTPKAAVQPWAWKESDDTKAKTSTPAFFAIRRQPAQSFFEIGIAEEAGSR
jgi:hypothetical protein